MVTGALIADKIFLVMQSLFALTRCNWRDATDNTALIHNQTKRKSNYSSIVRNNYFIRGFQKHKIVEKLGEFICSTLSRRSANVEVLMWLRTQ